MDALHYRRDDCRLCNGKSLEVAVPLLPTPIISPNSAASRTRADTLSAMHVPLDLYVCRDCGHLQLLDVVDPVFLYRNYLYKTSVSLGLADHFSRSADEILSDLAPQEGKLVVEIGSNDGSQLRPFQARGFPVLGVDPAISIAREASSRGIETLPEFFSLSIAESIKRTRGSAGLILANNVYANIDRLDEVTTAIRTLLADDGLFVFQTQYGADVPEKVLLDTIYHEHLSYFLIGPMARFFSSLRMEIIDVKRIQTKGGSIRVAVQHANGPRKQRPVVGELIAKESDLLLYRREGYVRFCRAIDSVRTRSGELVDAEIRAGRRVGGYGVSVGTSTLIAQLELGQRVSMLFDDDPEKVDKPFRGPGCAIPILPPAALVKENPGLVVVFAWRYCDPIIRQHGAYLVQGGKFLIPLPQVSVHSSR